MVITLSDAALRHLRLKSLELLDLPSFPGSQHGFGAERGSVDAVSGVGHRFLAMQGQDFPMVRWALGLRAGATEETVFEAFNTGRLVRSWPMRGTVHAMPGEDVGWIQALTNPRLLGLQAQRRREFLGLELSTIEQVRELCHEILAGGKSISRDGLFEAVSARGIEITGPMRYHIVWFLAQTGTLCQGPILAGGKDQALVLIDDWVPNQRSLDPEEAALEFALRYVGSHGPVTIKDLSWWTGLPQRDLKPGFAAAGDQLTEVLGEDGTKYWVATQLLDLHRTPEGEIQPIVTADDSPHVLLLPAFDEHLLGYGTRDHVLDKGHFQAVVPGNNGVFRPTIVVDGTTIGTWKRTIKSPKTSPRSVTITLSPFDAAAAKLLKSRQIAAGVELAAQAFADFGAHELASVITEE